MKRLKVASSSIIPSNSISTSSTPSEGQTHFNRCGSSRCLPLGALLIPTPLAASSKSLDPPILSGLAILLLLPSEAGKASGSTSPSALNDLLKGEAGPAEDALPVRVTTDKLVRLGLTGRSSAISTGADFLLRGEEAIGVGGWMEMFVIAGGGEVDASFRD